MQLKESPSTRADFQENRHLCCASAVTWRMARMTRCIYGNQASNRSLQDVALACWLQHKAIEYWAHDPLMRKGKGSFHCCQEPLAHYP
jgi:hypothetical protein